MTAMNSSAKYSDYSEEQVLEAFEIATDLIFVAEQASSLFVVSLALALVNTNTITLTFTLPAGKGRKLIIYIIEAIVKYLYQKNYDELLCKTYNFDWIKSSALYNKFKSLSDGNSVFNTYVLKFNQTKAVEYNLIPSISNATDEELKHETLIENANYEYIKEYGGNLLKKLLAENILTDEELNRSRFDVRCSLLRPGQSQNPLGLHCDFFKPKQQDRLKFYL